MILQQFSNDQFAAYVSIYGGDWRKAMAAMLLAWADLRNPEEPLVTLQKWGFFTFTFRVKHLRKIAELIAGPV